MRRSFKNLAVPAIAAGVLILAACSSGSSDSGSSSAAPESSAATSAADGAECGTTIEEIAAKAKEEGKVNLIALPDT